MASTIDDLYVAYRKAKIDMFYEKGHVTAIDFCRFEENLRENLGKLLKQLNSKNAEWSFDPMFVGGYAYLPKSLEIPSEFEQSNEGRFASADGQDPWLRSYEQGFSKSRKSPKSVFRLIGKHPVAFHVVSALWVHTVGHKFDAKLSASVYASRLRRSYKKLEPFGRVMDESLGNFLPYSRQFKNWRENGLVAMRRALEDDQSIVTLTADLKSFFHETSPEFLLNTTFLNSIGLDLSHFEISFTNNLIQAIKTWATQYS